MPLPALSDQDKQALAERIRSRTLETKRDLFPLISYLHKDSPHSFILTPAAYTGRASSTPADAMKGRLKLRFACAALHDSLMRGELPTSPVVKFPPELLNPASEHELTLRTAASLAALKGSSKCAVYYDTGIDDEMTYFLRAARALKIPVELRKLDLPGVLSRLPISSRREQAEETVQNLAGEARTLKKQFKAVTAKMTEGRNAALFDKLNDGSLTLADREAMAAYFLSKERVVVESPFAPWTYPEAGSLEKAFRTIDEEVNLYYAIHCLRAQFLKGHYAAASHAEFTYPGVLDDTNEHERTLGIAAGLAKTADWELTELNIDRHESGGMRKGEDFARMVGRKVVSRCHGDWPFEFSKPEADFFISLLG